MKRRDSHEGSLDTAETTAADPVALPAAGSQQREAAQEDAGRGTVFHFTRDGCRLKVKNEGEGDAGSVATVPADTSNQAWPNPSALLAVSGAVTDLFAKLAEDEKLSPQVAEVAAVKRTQHGVILDPHAVGEDASVADARRLMRQRR